MEMAAASWHRLLDHPLTQQLAAAGDGAVALRDAGKFLRLVGDALHRMLLNHPACAVLTGHRAILARQRVNGWAVRVRNLADQEERTLLSRNIVIAAGAHQPLDRLAEETVGGVKLDRTLGRSLAAIWRCRGDWRAGAGGTASWRQDAPARRDRRWLHQRRRSRPCVASSLARVFASALAASPCCIAVNCGFITPMSCPPRPTATRNGLRTTFVRSAGACFALPASAWIHGS